MIFGVLSEVFFEFESHLPLVQHLALKLFNHFLLCIEVLLENFLVISLLLRFLLIVPIKLLQLDLVLLRDLTDEHSIISATAILQ